MRLLTKLSFLLFAGFLILSGCNEPDTANAGSSIVTLPVDETSPEGDAATMGVMLIVPAADPNDENYISETAFEPGMTVGALLDAEAKAGIKFTMKSYPGMGRLVTGIDVVNNEDTPDHFWQYCVNGTIADKGIDEMELADGDEVQWHYVKYGETPCKKIGE